MPSSRHGEGSRSASGLMVSTSNTLASNRHRERLASIYFIGVLVILMLMTGAFAAWAVNWIVAETVQTVRSGAGIPGTPQQIVVTMPTPTPKIETPTVGSPGCQMNMICKTPLTPPIDCNKQMAGGQPCVFTGFTGDAQNEEEGHPEIFVTPSFPYPQ